MRYIIDGSTEGNKKGLRRPLFRIMMPHVTYARATNAPKETPTRDTTAPSSLSMIIAQSKKSKPSLSPVSKTDVRTVVETTVEI